VEEPARFGDAPEERRQLREERACVDLLAGAQRSTTEKSVVNGMPEKTMFSWKMRWKLFATTSSMPAPWCATTATSRLEPEPYASPPTTTWKPPDCTSSFFTVSLKFSRNQGPRISPV
jgi:hypothetical protein